MSISTEPLAPRRPFLLRRWPSLLAIAVCAPLLVFVELPHESLAVTVAACAVVYVVWSQFNRQHRVRQWLALAGFGAVTAAALLLDHRYAMFVIAAGLLGHAAWDVVHHRRRETVAPWYAELCAVVDVMLGAAVLALAFA